MIDEKGLDQFLWFYGSVIFAAGAGVTALGVWAYRTWNK